MFLQTVKTSTSVSCTWTHLHCRTCHRNVVALATGMSSQRPEQPGDFRLNEARTMVGVNEIGDAGAAALSEAFKSNATLTSLS